MGVRQERGTSLSGVVESGMQLSEIDEIASDLERLYRKDTKPFSCHDCRILQANAGTLDLSGFIPALVLFFSDVSGYSSRAGRLKTKGKDELDCARHLLSRSFYQRYPEYRSLEPVITPERTPQLHSDLQAHEEMRRKLLRLVSMLDS